MSDNPGSSGSKQRIRAALTIASVQIAGVLLLILGRKQGMIDGETATRAVMVVIGLSIAASGNRMPKILEGPQPQSLALAALRQAVLRVSGWAMMLEGLAYAGLWAFAPRDVAKVGSIVAVGAGAAVMFGYLAWRVLMFNRSSTS